MKVVLILLVSFSLQFLHVSSHGRFIVPASRASAWRYGFKTPANYDDHGKNCKRIKGCGICGDDKRHQTPGRYATGTITGEYKKGETIKTTAQITAWHGGFFVMKLCVNNNIKKDPTQACFDKNVLKTPNGETKFKLPPGAKKHSWQVKLPASVSCTQCILQWTWDVSAWNGAEEGFRSCSDIIISGGTNGGPTVPCPVTHPFAYHNGKWCCQTDKDCNGGKISSSSKCCQHSAYKQCPGTKCKNNEDGPPGPPCDNKKEHCDYWKGQGFCTKLHVKFMETYCKKSCSKCG